MTKVNDCFSLGPCSEENKSRVFVQACNIRYKYLINVFSYMLLKGHTYSIIKFATFIILRYLIKDFFALRMKRV